MDCHVILAKQRVEGVIATISLHPFFTASVWQSLLKVSLTKINISRLRPQPPWISFCSWDYLCVGFSCRSWVPKITPWSVASVGHLGYGPPAYHSYQNELFGNLSLIWYGVLLHSQDRSESMYKERKKMPFSPCWSVAGSLTTIQELMFGYALYGLHSKCFLNALTW